jgi:hypothetical protein
MMRIRHRTTSNPLYETARETVSPASLEAKGLDNPIARRVYTLQKGYQTVWRIGPEPTGVAGTRQSLGARLD